MTRTLKGTIVSIKMEKTAGVRVESLKSHRLYGKVLKRRKKYLVDTGGFSDLKTGEKVEIEETRPVSKRKRWRLMRRIQIDDLKTEQKTNNPKRKV